MSTFCDYAKYYNLLYEEKKYSSEVDYIESLLKKYSTHPVHTILDIGCGTGRHDLLLAQRGYEVWGIDRSEAMIALAEQSRAGMPDLHFSTADATAFQLGRKFDAVVSLFHVVSYQTTDREVLALFKNALLHLSETGMFIFDFWYGPAVIAAKPEVKVKRVENREIKLTRIAEPLTHEQENTVTVQYELIVENTTTHVSETVTESHTMRYFFCPELAAMLAQAGFTISKRLAWLSCDEDLSSQVWSGVIIAKRP